MLPMEEASQKAKALADAMSALSKQLFDADWHQGCELPIWHALVSEDSAWRRRADDTLLRNLASVWVASLGWVVWDEALDRLVWLTENEWHGRRVAMGEEDECAP